MELHSTFKETFPSTPKHIVNEGVMSQVGVQRYVGGSRAAGETLEKITLLRVKIVRMFQPEAVSTADYKVGVIKR